MKLGIMPIIAIGLLALSGCGGLKKKSSDDTNPPAATPVITPAATPVITPAATPVITPAATPGNDQNPNSPDRTDQPLVGSENPRKMSYVSCDENGILRSVDDQGTGVCDYVGGISSRVYASAENISPLSDSSSQLADELIDCGLRPTPYATLCLNSQYNIINYRSFEGHDQHYIFYSTFRDKQNKTMIAGVIYTSETKKSDLYYYSKPDQMFIIETPESTDASYLQDVYNRDVNNFKIRFAVAGPEEMLDRLQSASDLRRYVNAVKNAPESSSVAVESSLRDQVGLIRDSGDDVYQNVLLRYMFTNKKAALAQELQTLAQGWINKKNKDLQSLAAIILAEAAVPVTPDIMAGLRYAIASDDELLIIHGIPLVTPLITVQDKTEIQSIIHQLGKYNSDVRSVAFTSLKSFIKDQTNLAGYETFLAAELDGYGNIEAVQLLAATPTAASTSYLCSKVLPQYEEKSRYIAFEALKMRNLIGYEGLLNIALTSNGVNEATQLLTYTTSDEATRDLINSVLDQYDEKLRKMAYEALAKRSLDGCETILAGQINGYGKLQAVQLLANIKSQLSTTILINQVLSQYDEKIRGIAYESLLSRSNLAGQESLLGQQIDGYGSVQAVKLLGNLITIDSSKILITKSLGNFTNDVRSLVFESLKKRDLTGLESLLAAHSDDYGSVEAAELLIHTQTNESSSFLIRIFLGLYDEKLRNTVSTELKKRNQNLFGFEKDLGAQISGYGSEQAVDILAVTNSQNSSLELIDLALNQFSDMLRTKAYDALIKRPIDLHTYRAKLEVMAKDFNCYGKEEAQKLLKLL